MDGSDSALSMTTQALAEQYAYLQTASLSDLQRKLGGVEAKKEKYLEKVCL